MRQAVARHYANPQALRQELDALGLDRRHLTRLFERTCGHSVQEEAPGGASGSGPALLDRGCTATETAFAVGFGSFGGLYRLFPAADRPDPVPVCRLPPADRRLLPDLHPGGHPLPHRRRGGPHRRRFCGGPADAPRSPDRWPRPPASWRSISPASRREFHLPLRLRGSGFQQRVWQALQQIPYGQTRSYGQIAEAIGAPKAARAVGLACNRNPLLILIPCHRVVGRDGRLVGYAGGLDRKERLLSLEARTLG